MRRRKTSSPAAPPGRPPSAPAPVSTLPDAGAGASRWAPGDPAPAAIRVTSYVQGPGLPTVSPGAVALHPHPAMLARLPVACWEAIDLAAYRAAAVAGRRVTALERPPLG